MTTLIKTSSMYVKILALVFFAINNSLLLADEAIKLTDKRGRTIEVTILKIEENNVTVKRAKDSKEFIIPLDSLINKDIETLKKWKNDLQKISPDQKPHEKFSYKIYIPDPKKRNSPLLGVKRNDGLIIIDPAKKESIRRGYQASLNGFKESIKRNLEHFGTVPFRDQSNKWGLKNFKGEIILEPQYEHISPTRIGFLKGGHDANAIYIYRHNKKYGILNIKGKVIHHNTYKSIGWFIDGVASAEINNKFYLIDHNGTHIGKRSFEEIYSSSNHVPDRRFVKINGEWKLFDLKQEHIISGFTLKEDGETKLEKSFVCGRTWVMEKGKWGLIDTDGKMIGKRDWGAAFKEPIVHISIRLGRRPDFVRQGTGRFSQAHFSPNVKLYAIVEKDGKVGVINCIDGSIAIQPRWDYCQAASHCHKSGYENSIITAWFVRKDGKWGMVSLADEVMVAPQWKTPGACYGKNLIIAGSEFKKRIYNTEGMHGKVEFQGNFYMNCDDRWSVDQWTNLNRIPVIISANKIIILNEKGDSISNKAYTSFAFEGITSEDPKITDLRAKVTTPDGKTLIIDGDEKVIDVLAEKTSK